MLGRFPLPIEIAPFGAAATRRAVEAAAAAARLPGCGALLRKAADGHAFVTDGGHRLLDARLQRIPDPTNPGAGFRRSRASWNMACSSAWRGLLLSPVQTGCASSSGPDIKYQSTEGVRLMIARLHIGRAISRSPMARSAMTALTAAVLVGAVPAGIARPAVAQGAAAPSAVRQAVAGRPCARQADTWRAKARRKPSSPRWSAAWS